MVCGGKVQFTTHPTILSTVDKDFSLSFYYCRVGSENNPPSAPTCSLHSVLTHTHCSAHSFHSYRFSVSINIVVVIMVTFCWGPIKKNVPLSPIRFTKLQLHARFNLLCPTHTFTNVVSRNSCTMKLLNYSRKTGRTLWPFWP